jgi:hypothetical protein
VAGHISVRDPILTDHFWLNPLSMHFSLICVSDLILVNEDGDVVEGDQPINAAAFAIHSESESAMIFSIYLFYNILHFINSWLQYHIPCSTSS